jgi:hypothetical protein
LAVASRSCFSKSRFDIETRCSQRDRAAGRGQALKFVGARGKEFAPSPDAQKQGKGSLMQKHLLAIWLPLVAAFFLFALPASATVIYMYEGYNYTNITDIDPPAGTYDTSMNLSGWFTLD